MRLCRQPVLPPNRVIFWTKMVLVFFRYNPTGYSDGEGKGEGGPPPQYRPQMTFDVASWVAGVHVGTRVPQFLLHLLTPQSHFFHCNTGTG